MKIFYHHTPAQAHGQAIVFSGNAPQFSFSKKIFIEN
jgi:hypothetical protein